MATAVMDRTVKSAADDRRRSDRSVEEIIDTARRSPTPARGAIALSMLTAVLLWAAFTPLDWGPLAWLALVPLIQLVRLPQPSPRMYRYVYLGGMACSLVMLQWMRLGDVMMYPAWFALAAYVALYFPVFVGLSRVAVHRWRIPLSIAVPVVWVGLEFARAHLLSGFAWYFLGHTQHEWTRLVQISDVFGTYGVSFLVALGNAVLAGLAPPSVWRRLGVVQLDQPVAEDTKTFRPIWSVAALLVLLGLTLGYGTLRRADARFEAGPRVALVQGNFPSTLKRDANSWEDMFHTHNALTGLAVQQQPDLIVWPETMFTWPLMSYAAGMTDEQLTDVHPQIPAQSWKSDEVQGALLDLSQKSGATLILGIETLEASPDSLRRYNSAVLVNGDSGVSGRYDKLHLVPFGEFVPLGEQLPFLQQIFGFMGDPPLSRGERIHFFNVDGARLAPVICFEDTVPHLVREIVAAGQQEGRQVDCLVNLTNDGWFHGSSELDQHLITASFRCIETRTPMVRAVNTGISAIIDGDGLVREPEKFIDYDAMRTGEAPRTTMRDPDTGRYHKSLNAALVGYIPLDPRQSLYTRFGDWFAIFCAAVCCVMAVSARWMPLSSEAIAPR